jgi:hypothetical protein
MNYRDKWLRQYSYIAENIEHEDNALVWAIYDIDSRACMDAYDKSVFNNDELMAMLGDDYV